MRNMFRLPAVSSFALAACALVLSSAARAAEEDAGFAPPAAPAATDMAPADAMAPTDAMAPAAAPMAPVSEEMAPGAFGAGEEETQWGPAPAAASTSRIGVRGGFLIPSSDYDAGPSASFFWQKGFGGKLTLELEFGFAQLASSDATVSSSLMMGGASAQMSLSKTDKRDFYVQAGLGAISESAESATTSTSSMLSTIDISVGLTANRCIDVRAGLAMLPSSDNVDSLARVSFGIIY